MNKQLYGNSYQSHLIEQYKICVEMADRISDRRMQTNKFYISILSIFLTLPSLILEKKLSDGYQNTIFLLTALLGFALCAAWLINIESYRKLNSAKFKIINEMEADIAVNNAKIDKQTQSDLLRMGQEYLYERQNLEHDKAVNINK